jgi:adenylylsulfate kinase-like enzyme
VDTYGPPGAPEIRVNTAQMTAEAAADVIVESLAARG